MTRVRDFGVRGAWVHYTRLFGGCGARFLGVAALVLVAACGSAVHDAQQVIRYSGYAIRDVDAVIAPQYLAAHNVALAESTDLATYRLRMQPWVSLETALRLSYSAFVAADQAIEVSSELPLAGRLACLLSSLSVIADRLGDMHLVLPEALTKALSLAVGFTGECTESPPAGAEP